MEITNVTASHSLTRKRARTHARARAHTHTHTNTHTQTDVVLYDTLKRIRFFLVING
jgi:hypothetical protein